MSGLLFQQRRLLRSGAAPTTTKKKATGIVAGVLIPGKGKPKKDQAVVAKDGKIVYVGASNSLPLEDSDIDWKHVPVLMPGMWECNAISD